MNSTNTVLSGGLLSLTDPPAPLALDAFDWVQLTATGITEASIDALYALPYPRFYLAIAAAPEHVGVSLEWSCLAEDSWERLTRSQSHVMPGTDPHRELAQSLVAALAYMPIAPPRIAAFMPSACSEAGPVFVWNSVAVQASLSDLAVVVPDLAPDLQRISPRLVDLQPLMALLFQNHNPQGWEKVQPSPVFLAQLAWLLAREALCTWLGDLPESLKLDQPEQLIRACAALRKASEEAHPTLIRGPASLLQRRLKLGYKPTLVLIQQLQALGVLSPMVQIPFVESQIEQDAGGCKE